MRDGVQLAAYVTVPADADGNAIDTPLPVVLVQTSYNGAAGSVVSAIGGADPYITAHGYVTVTVDVRGNGQSQGEWEAFGEEIGRAACRERVCQYVEMSGGAGYLKKK